jgi:hypothetical protein
MVTTVLRGLRRCVPPATPATAALAIAAPAALAIAALLAPAPALASLSTRNITPLPASKTIVGAWWASRRYNPPTNQWGDILPTIWGDDGNQYTIMDDGGTDVPLAGGVWRQSLAQITGMPPRIRFIHIGDRDKPPPATFGQIRNDPKLWLGPLGPYYSSGLVEANHVFYATQELDWDWTANGPFAGLAGIAYSLNHGEDWQFANKPFPAPLGNLNWVIRGQGGVFADGYVYAIASEREFNANTLILGRTRPDVAEMIDPAQWQWVSGWTTQGGVPWPVFSSSLQSAVPILSWSSHITYPQMSFDSPIHRYLLTFTYAYSPTPPATWKDGEELVILEAPHPWGPFSFVAAEPDFGPSNGYGAGFPIKWISRNGHDLWLKWAANFDGCSPHLDCSGGYGFNYRRIHLTLAGRH